MKQNKPKTKTDAIEALLNKQDTISNPVLQRALNKVKEEKEKEIEKDLIENLKSVQDHVDFAVKQLKNQRKLEAASKKYLTAVVEAQLEFHKTANFAVFEEKRAEAYRDFLRNCKLD